MYKFTKITKRNWHKFEYSEDSVTLEPYAIGDEVAKCGNCHNTFHAKYITDGKCPSCRQTFVSESILVNPVTLKIGGRLPPLVRSAAAGAGRRPVNRPSPPAAGRRVFNPANAAYTALKALCWTSLVLSAAALLGILFADFPYRAERLTLFMHYLGIRFEARIWRPLLSFQNNAFRRMGLLFQSRELSSKAAEAGRLWGLVLSSSFDTIRTVAERIISVF